MSPEGALFCLFPGSVGGNALVGSILAEVGGDSGGEEEDRGSEGNEVSASPGTSAYDSELEDLRLDLPETPSHVPQLTRRR